MFQYCPCCASRSIQFIDNRKFSCPDCGYAYYHNTAAASGCIISNGTHIMLLIRGKHPALGKLDLPGGFVNPGEGILEGLARECREEIGWAPDLDAPQSGRAGKSRKSKKPAFIFFASFPNVYPYKGVTYNTCDIFFTLTVPGLTEKDLRLDLKENQGVRFVNPRDLDFDELAFDSTRRVMGAYIAYLDSPQN
ncbi:MAG: NUDIX domain-containing protein [Treponema sp.]|nr:NUDIX domain-containing protein [Treponema sp.]